MPNNNKKRRVLLVEPDREFSSILADFLSAQRFEVETAAGGDEGLDKIVSFGPDVVLLSRELPMPEGNHGPDGLRVLKSIKQERKFGRVPVIMSSSEVTESDFDRYRKLKFSADDYIRKPFEDTEILRRLENLVGFDLSEGMGDIHDRIDEVMDDSIESMFDADPEELGINQSAATRREVSRLLEQVGQELDRQDESIQPDNGSPAPEEREEQSAEAPPSDVARTDDSQTRLKAEITSLNRQLDRMNKQLVSERKRSREIKKEWKSKLLEIEKRLEESEDRESAMREEFEAMRVRFADQELEHTMEVDRIEAEKRDLEEELLNLREKSGDDSQLSPAELEDEISGAAETLQSILKKLRK